MRYLKGDPIEDPGQDYPIVDGVVLEPPEIEEHRPNSRQGNAVTRLPRSKAQLEAEEASWAARSGPVYIVRPAKGRG